MLKKLFILTATIALCCAITGCQSKPKIDFGNLNNLSKDAGAGKGGAAGEDGFVQGPDGGIGGGVNGKSDSLGGSDTWKSGDNSLQLDGAGTALLNPERWTDCVVYFAYNQSELQSSERSKVDALVDYLSKNPKTGVCIEGNTDERGSDEYNRALGERRAISVKNYITNCGIDATRIITVSNGEDKPAVPNAATDEDHQRNRRAEFVIGDLK